MNSNSTLLGIEIPTDSKEQVREKIIKNILQDKQYFHIISLNSENFVLASQNQDFKKIVREAQIRIVDGYGVELGAKLRSISIGDRYSGVDLMSDLLKEANDRRLRVLLIGGSPKIAEKVVECQKQLHPAIEITATQGISDISNPTAAEDENIASIVTATKPHIVFVSFGSPSQELWIDRHKKLFEGMVVMGVGGAFDFLSGTVPRAPLLLRKLGLEWLFRLLIQPWRIKRQLRLITFLWLVLSGK